MSGSSVPGAERSLCRDCEHLRVVTSGRGSVFWRCRSPEVPVKYPPQPVLRCDAHSPRPKE